MSNEIKMEVLKLYFIWSLSSVYFDYHFSRNSGGQSGWFDHLALSTASSLLISSYTREMVGNCSISFMCKMMCTLVEVSKCDHALCQARLGLMHCELTTPNLMAPQTAGTRPGKISCYLDDAKEDTQRALACLYLQTSASVT